MDEFLKRETTYWSKVAQKAIDGGKMTFWAVLAKVGGVNESNSPNVLFINTFPNMNADLSDVWNAAKLFPNVPMAKMDTYGMSTVIADYFLQDQGWQEIAKANRSAKFARKSLDGEVKGARHRCQQRSAKGLVVHSPLPTGFKSICSAEKLPSPAASAASR